jgi:DNA-binding beta-propeller fold protein YncE
VAALAGCGAPDAGRAAPGGPRLYVANAVDGTVTPLDGRTLRAAGPALPAGVLPGQVVPGPDGSLLVRSFAPSPTGRLTHIARAGAGGRAWAARPVPLEAGARDVWLAGAGRRYAAVAYLAPDPATGRLRCRVALVDARLGTVQPAHTVGVDLARITGLALDGGPEDAATPLAYLGALQRSGRSRGGPPEGEDGDGRSLLLSVDPATGAVGAARPLAGAPSDLVMAPAPDRVGTRLYAAEAPPGPDAPGGASRGRVLRLDPVTLDVEGEYRLPSRPVALAVAPDGEQAYALTADGLALTRVDLRTGAQQRLAWLRDTGTALAVDDARVYVPNAWGDEVWVYDRRSARPLPPVRVGHYPVAVAVGGSL